MDISFDELVYLPLTPIDNLIQSNNIDIILLPLHVYGNHWTLLRINFLDSTYSYADCLHQHGFPPTTTFSLIKWWLDSLLPNSPPLVAIPFEFGLPRQSDSFSCGIVVLDLMANLVLDYPLWAQNRAAVHRMEWFLRLSNIFDDLQVSLLIILYENHSYQFNQASNSGGSDNESDNSSLLRLSNIFDDLQVSLLIILYENHSYQFNQASNSGGSDNEPDNSSLPPTSPLSIPLSPSFAPNALDTPNAPSPTCASPDNQGEQSSRSRKRPLTHLCSAPASTTDMSSEDESDSHEGRYLARRHGSSRINLESSWSAQKRLRDHAKQSKPKPIKGRLQGFRSKIKSEDPHAEFHSMNTLLVRCSACAEWITMRAVHDTRRWKEHRLTSKCTKNRASGLATRSLFALGFSKSTSQPPSSKHTGTIPLPCPGLLRLTDHCIDHYMSCTSASGGGAPSHRTITAQLFPSEAATPWQDLFPKQHRAVLRQEESLYA